MEEGKGEKQAAWILGVCRALSRSVRGVSDFLFVKIRNFVDGLLGFRPLIAAPNSWIFASGI